MTRHWVLPIALAGLGVILATNVWVARNPPSSEPIMSGEPPKAGEPEPLNESGAASSVQLTHMNERPLFLRSRRPWEPPPPVEPPLPQAEPVVTIATPPPVEAAELNVTLLGVQRGPSANRALVAISGEAEPRWLEKGELVGGWSVSAIESGSVLFSTGDLSRTITLYAKIEGAPQ